MKEEITRTPTFQEKTFTSSCSHMKVPALLRQLLQ